MRPAIFVLLALVLSASTLANIVHGADSAAGAGLHLGAAILISWVAVGTVSHVVTGYRAAALRRAHERAQHPEH
jgi:hypothetical protein